MRSPDHRGGAFLRRAREDATPPKPIRIVTHHGEWHALRFLLTAHGGRYAFETTCGQLLSGDEKTKHGQPSCPGCTRILGRRAPERF